MADSDRIVTLHLVIPFISMVTAPATATRDSHHCTCLGHLGRKDKKYKWSYLYCPAQGVAVTDVITLTFANGNTALRPIYTSDFKVLFHIKAAHFKE